MANLKSQKSDDQRNARSKEREQDAQIERMRRYPPSLNGINKNLP
jgi:hypothetical protein